MLDVALSSSTTKRAIWWAGNWIEPIQPAGIALIVASDMFHILVIICHNNGCFQRLTIWQLYKKNFTFKCVCVY